MHARRLHLVAIANLSGLFEKTPTVSLFTVCRWAESELLDTLMRLEIGLAGRVEAWKATRWAAKLEQLKSKNDSLVSPHLPTPAVDCMQYILPQQDPVKGSHRDSVQPSNLFCASSTCCAAVQAQALESAVKRFSKLEDAAHEAQLATDIHAVRPPACSCCAQCFDVDARHMTVETIA